MRNIVVAILALALQACSQSGSGAGVATGAAERSDMTSGRQIQKDRSRTATKSTEASIQYPASGLLVEALFTPSELANQGRAFRLDSIRNGIRWELFRHSDSRETALQRAKAPIAAIMAPFRGWEVDPFADSRIDQQRLTSYLRTIEASAHYANLVMTELAGKMTLAPQKNPEAAKREIRRLWAGFDHTMLASIWEKSLEASTGDIVLDLASGQGVGWSAGNNSFAGDAQGLVWQKNGQVWLGDGRLSGRLYQIALESAIGAEMRATSTATTLEEVGSHTETAGTASAGK